jgi:hypothetical protein
MFVIAAKFAAGQRRKYKPRPKSKSDVEMPQRQCLKAQGKDGR